MDKTLQWDAKYALIARTARGGHAIVYPWPCLREAREAGISPALALAIAEQESHGHNVFGHDPTIFAGAGYVTKAKYLSYKKARQASHNTKMQGVGPAQLTWWEFQDAADRRGGCWKREHNYAVAFERLRGLIKIHGLHAGVAAYNGSGPRAEAYANSVLAKRDYWRNKLFGVGLHHQAHPDDHD